MSAAGALGAPVWSGTWVARWLGVRLEDAGGADGLGAHDLVGLALRRNPRRAHLLVSTVLGKHVPTDPRLVRAAALRLGHLVGDALDAGGAAPGPSPALWRAALAGDGAAAASALASLLAPPPRAPHALVLAYAETATGLGHGVAQALGCACLHSTRRSVPGAVDAAAFEEEHSHATGHQVLAADPQVLAALDDPRVPLVLVDDELSTGRTVANTLRVLHARTARRRYVVAGLLDVRSDADRAALEALGAELGARVDVVALARGRVHLPVDVLARGAALAAAAAPPPVPAAEDREDPAGPGDVAVLDGGWPDGLPVTGRAGTSAADGSRVAAACEEVAGRLAGELAPRLAGRPGPREVLVLATEELLDVPQRVAAALAGRLPALVPGARVLVSSTTRSPVPAVDDPGYAVRTSLALPSTDRPVDGPGPRYAHNVPGGPGGGRRWAACVLVADTASPRAALLAPGGPLAALRPSAGHLLLVHLPADARELAP